MKRSSAKLNAYEQHKMKWTARFGYGMFAIVVINTLITLGSVLQGLTHLHNGGGKFLPQFLWFVSLSSFAAVVPPMVAYLVGERNAKTDSAYEHHYNGVLFALLASWLSITLSLIPLPPQAQESWVYVPGVAAFLSLVITLVVAIAYGRHAKSIRLQQYTPYRFLLILTILILFIVGTLTTLQYALQNGDPSLLAIVLMPAIVSGLILWFGYEASREVSRWSRVIDSVIGLSIGMWMVNLSQLLFYSFHVISFIQEAPMLIGVLAWAIYLYLIHLRAPSPAKRKTRH